MRASAVLNLGLYLAMANLAKKGSWVASRIPPAPRTRPPSWLPFGYCWLLLGVLFLHATLLAFWLPFNSRGEPPKIKKKLKKGQAALPRTTPKPQDTEKTGSGRGSRSGSRFEPRFGKVLEGQYAISGNGQLSGASLAMI